MKPQIQMVRCHMVSIETAKDRYKKEKPPSRVLRKPRFEMHPEIASILAPWPHRVMIFDTETLTGIHTGQPARFGWWQSRGLKYAERCELLECGELTAERHDACWEEGIFYDPAHCSKKEIETIKRYARTHKRQSGGSIKVLALDAFVDRVFVGVTITNMPRIMSIANMKTV